ncbi:MAG: 4-phosphopantetheinyl transferase family protein, partial [Gammaproteobacteria bacterium]|nr:4-phosphopantetheinyl transferase family protein [Gammaproteobacteria bacterium]
WYVGASGVLHAAMAAGILDDLLRRERYAWPIAARDALFVRLWTRKESLLKARGTGFVGGARDFDVRDDEVGEFRVRSLSLPIPGVAALTLPQTARLRAAYVLS